jgi:hypothetical protein
MIIFIVANKYNFISKIENIHKNWRKCHRSVPPDGKSDLSESLSAKLKKREIEDSRKIIWV